MLTTFLLAASWHLIVGAWHPPSGPDGNSVLLDAPDGLIVVDTGRHPAHQEMILAAAKARGKPIAAIVNTHWHLDHSGGNAELRAAFPGVPIVSSAAVDAALGGFLKRSRAAAEAHIASGKASPAQVAETRRDMAAGDDLANLRPDVVVASSGLRTIAGRRLNVHLERHAATAGDVWLHAPEEGLVLAGDLVVGLAPFMDTACPEGWRKALGNIAAVPFRTLLPGHGAPMSRAQFRTWRTAFDNLLDCAGGGATKQHCIDGWMRDATAFIAAGERPRVSAMIGYYIDTRLRAAPGERNRYCEGGSG